MWISRRKMRKLDDDKARGISIAVSDSMKALIKKYKLPPAEALAIFAEEFSKSLDRSSGFSLGNEDTDLKMELLKLEALKEKKRKAPVKKAVSKKKK